ARPEGYRAGVAGGLALVVVLPPIVAAVVLRLVSHVLLRGRPRVQRLVDDYALWAVIPFVVVYLLLVAWPLAIIAAVVAPLVIRFVERFYFIPRSDRIGYEQR